MKNEIAISQAQIETRIFTIRGVQVMIDRDLAEIYQVEVKRLNEQVKRNIERFPSAFRFQLTNNEFFELVAICDRYINMKHSSVNPYAFTEQGVAMLSAVLRSEIAVKVSISIMQAFVDMRKLLIGNAGLLQRVENIEKKQLETDQKFEQVFKALEATDEIPKQGVFFDGQVFDAYILATKIVRSAKQSIVLVDNFIDESVLALLGKKEANVKVTLLTKYISRQLQLDIDRANEQYPTIEVKIFEQSHDRFLIIDFQDVYHLGASLKDLGKKWFAFSKIDKSSVAIIRQIKELL